MLIRKCADTSRLFLYAEYSSRHRRFKWIFKLSFSWSFSLPIFSSCVKREWKFWNSREPMGRNEAKYAKAFVEKIVHNRGRSAKTSNAPHSVKDPECYHCVGRKEGRTEGWEGKRGEGRTVCLRQHVLTLGSSGGSNWTIQSTSGMSRPRAATSVHSSVPDVALMNSKNVVVRFCCFCLPWGR